MKEFLLQLVELLPLMVFPYMWGYDDGRMKKDGTEAHWPKWFLYPILGYLMYYGFMAESLLSVGITLVFWPFYFKPLFDYGWTKGSGKRGLYIGKTSVFDKMFRWILFFVHKLVPKKARKNLKELSFLPAIYLFMCFISIILTIHFNK
jgi:hypothetical protein